MENPLQYQQHLDELIAYASTDEHKTDLIAGKAEYLGLTGEVFEDDKTFEMRMASFLDYYLFDRPHPAAGKTPARVYFEQEEPKSAPDRAAALRAFTETIHGLFEVKKLGTGMVRLRELFTDKDYNVTERRSMVALEKGDVLEARLIPFGGHLLFSASFCYHPREASKVIKKEVKRRRKKEPTRPIQEMTWDAAKRALKADRYRQISLEKIYDFENAKI